MKRGSIVLVLAVFMLAAVGIPQTVSAGSIGYVDFEFLFNAHPEYDLKNGELQVLAEELTEQFQIEAERLTTEAEIEQLARQYEARLDQFAEELRISIINSVQSFISQLAQRENISVVIPDTLIIYGGINLTPLVLEFMYESYGISVPSHLRDFL